MTTVGGRYTLLERIGSGAMGVVWRARDEVLAREVAVKQLVTGDHQKAIREARNAARLHHPHAIAVFDVVGSDDQEPWIIMEYLPSQSLSALIAERGPMKPAQAARIGGFIASALAAAHNAGLVHRDIKPGNVLIGHDGTVKITDFGISKASGDGTMTDTGMIAGTPAYLAPEVARGEQPGEASDVFSLGATIYSAIEGESVFGPSDNSFGLIYRAASGQVRDPKNAGELTPLLMRLLATDPQERPSAQEAAELLASAPQPSQPLVVPELEPEPKKRKAPSRRILVPLAVVAVLAIGGSAAAATYWGGWGGNGNPANGGPINQADFSLSNAPRPRYFEAGEAITFVQSYYALLPIQADEAWRWWGKEREPETAFVNKWRGYSSLKCTLSTAPVRSDGPNWVVTVDLAMLTDLGKPLNITVEVSVAAVNNEMKIAGLKQI